MNLPTFGHYLLLAAFAASVLNVGATIFAFLDKNRQNPTLHHKSLLWADRAVRAAWIFLMGASAVLITLFLTDNFAVKYVWNNSAIAQPLFYKIAAFWGGQAGSLLMWAAMLGTYGLLVANFGRKNRLEITPAAVAVICFVNAFFVGLILTQANPFGLIVDEIPPDGFGLNPLLQNYWMQIHPPTLYIGYIGCTVPFAFAVAGLLHRRFDEEWVRVIRRWTLITWIVLFVGIVLGGIWAYETLGWGGYWAWDPVENASLLPWLVLTAFLHSIMLQGRRGILKDWNIVLVTLTFLLSIFGTFLTRSGIVTSVHSFAESDIGGYFLGFLGVCFLLTAGLIWWRRDELVSKGQVESTFSREGSFVIGNWLWLATTFAILFGTIYPVIYEALQGTKITVEQSYFNRTTAPLGLLILALAGISPLFAWRKTSWRELARKLQSPIWITAIGIPLVAGPALYFLARPLSNKWSTGAATAFVLVLFLVGALGGEFYRGARARQRSTNESFFSALLALPLQNRQRYGGYIVHLGLALFFVGLTGSSVFQIELEPRDLEIGEILPIGEYALRFDGFRRPEVLEERLNSDVAVQMTVLKNGQPILDSNGKPIALFPNIEIFKVTGFQDPAIAETQEEQVARRPAILSNLGHDLYLALLGYDMEEGVATIKAYLNPLVMWIWVAVGFFISGTVISLLPDSLSAQVLRGRSRRTLEMEESLLEEQIAEAHTNGHAITSGADPSHIARLEQEAEAEIAIARFKLQSSGKSTSAVAGKVEVAEVAEQKCECGQKLEKKDRFCSHCGAANIQS